MNGLPLTESAYWLVSAFNPGDLGDPRVTTTAGDDHFKLEALRAVLPELRVPEPGSLALFGLGALLAGAFSRRKS